MIVLAAMSLGVLAYRASYDQQLYRSGSESALGYHDLQRGYPSGALYPTKVVVSADAGAPKTDLDRSPPSSARCPESGGSFPAGDGQRPGHRDRPAAVD